MASLGYVALFLDLLATYLGGPLLHELHFRHAALHGYAPWLAAHAQLDMWHRHAMMVQRPCAPLHTVSAM